ncbi:MAG TPA: TonB C-terminal domain-containing protein [Chroococcales cyanobacterium]
MIPKILIFAAIFSLVLLIVTGTAFAVVNTDDQQWSDCINQAALDIAEMHARDAEPLLKKSLSIATKIDNHHRILSLLALGSFHLKMHDLQLADLSFSEAKGLLTESSDIDRFAQIEVCEGLARLCEQRGDKEGSKKCKASAVAASDALMKQRLAAPEYLWNIQRTVFDNWKSKHCDAGGPVGVRFAVEQDGSVKLVYISSSSGNQQTDQKAIASIANLPPAPKSLMSPLMFQVELNEKGSTWNESQLRIEEKLKRIANGESVSAVDRVNTYVQVANSDSFAGNFIDADSNFSKAMELASELPSKQIISARIYRLWALSKQKERKPLVAEQYVDKAIELIKPDLPSARQLYVDLLTLRTNLLGGLGRTDELVKCLADLKAAKDELAEEKSKK